MKKRIFILLVLFLHSGILFSTENSTLMEKVINNYTRFNSISASMVQHIFNPDGSFQRFTGDYAASGEGLMRIDYYSPSRQIVINNHKGLYWFYPDHNIVFVSESGESRNESLPAFLKRISDMGGGGITLEYEGRRFYNFFRRAHVYSIHLKNGMRIRVWVEPEGRYILRKYVIDTAGREIVKELYSNYIESDGIYVPAVIEVHARTNNGTVRTLTEYSNIKINGELNKKIFDFAIKSSMEVRSFNGN